MNPSETAVLRIQADLKNLAAIRDFLEEAAGHLGLAADAIADLVLAVDEAATNIILHGYRGEPGSIEIAVSHNGSGVQVRLRDQAPRFDPTTVPPPDLNMPLDQRRFGGFGVYLIRRCTDEVRYCPAPQGGNELTLVKRAP